MSMVNASENAKVKSKGRAVPDDKKDYLVRRTGGSPPAKCEVRSAAGPLLNLWKSSWICFMMIGIGKEATLAEACALLIGNDLKRIPEWVE